VPNIDVKMSNSNSNSNSNNNHHSDCSFGLAVLSGEIKEQVILGGDSMTEKLISSVIHSRAEAVNLLDTGGGILACHFDFHGQFQLGDQVWHLTRANVKAPDFCKENDPEDEPGTFENLLKAVRKTKRVKALWKDGFKPNERFLEGNVYLFVCSTHALLSASLFDKLVC
jgi:hypothetical protein